MANKLSKVVSKKPAAKQKPVPVRIVSDSVGLASSPKRGVDKWEAQDALRTLQRAREIEKNKPLMKAAKAEAQAQIKALSSVK